jgi:hypothetical protein
VYRKRALLPAVGGGADGGVVCEFIALFEGAIMFRALLIFISMLFAPSVVFAADSLPRWISGSYVNVRSQPSLGAEIVEHLVANTPVKLMSQQEDFCEIAWGNNQHGFVACKLLGDKALRLEDIGTKPKYDEKPNPLYSPQRAFWIEPTVERLFDAGEYFRVTMLPAGQLKAENDFVQNYWNNLEKISQGGNVPELKRFHLPEFDAMKKLMADGVIAPRSQYAPLMSWESIRSQINSIQTLPKAAQSQRLLGLAPYLATDHGLNVVMYEHIKLPTAKPSFFKSVEEIGRPSAGAEQLSAQYQIPHRVTVLDKPMWGGDNNSYPILMGAWDIGKVESRLTRPVYEVALGIDGEIAVGETVAETQRLKSENTCEGEFKKVTSKTLEIEKPLIFFRLGAPPTFTKAKVTIKKLNKFTLEDDLEFEQTLAAQRKTIERENAREVNSFKADNGLNRFNAAAKPGMLVPLDSLPQPNLAPAPDLPKEKVAYTKFVATSEQDDSHLELTTARIDIDRDGVIDLFVWDDGIDRYDHQWPGNMARTRLFFANVAGQWYLLDTDEEHACGC